MTNGDDSKEEFMCKERETGVKTWLFFQCKSWILEKGRMGWRPHDAEKEELGCKKGMKSWCFKERVGIKRMEWKLNEEWWFKREDEMQGSEDWDEELMKCKRKVVEGFLLQQLPKNSVHEIGMIDEWQE